MAYLTKQQVKDILDKAPANLDRVKLVESLVKQGNQLEGLTPQNTQETISQLPSSQINGTQSTENKKDKSFGGFLGNIVKSGFDTVKNVGSAAINVFNPDSEKNTLANIARVGLGTIEKIIPGRQGAENQADAIGIMLKDRYGSFDKIKETAYTDPVGFLLDASAVLGGSGALLKAAGTTAKVSEVARAGEVISKAGSLIDPLNAVSKGAELTSKGLKVGLGATTGVGSEVIEQGYNAAKTGGGSRASFTESMRGGTSGEDILGQAKQALGSIKDQRAASYRSKLSGIKNSDKILDINPIKTKVDELLTKFGIGKTEEGLDFSRSTIGDGVEANKVQRIYDDVVNWGSKPGDLTPLGVDTLKRRIANEFSPHSDVRSFVQGVKKETDSLLKSKVEGYEKMTSEYSKMSDLIDDIQQNLSLGEKSSVETGIKKLTSALRQNNEMRIEFIKQLEGYGGKDILSSVAGNQLSSIAPRGLMKIVSGGGALSAITTGQLLQFLPAIALTSPRLVGELLNVLGSSARMLNKTKIPKIINPAIKAGVQLERSKE